MTAEIFEGVVERITYHNEESGYTVLRLKPHKALPGQVGRDGLATVVGVFPSTLREGTEVRFRGTWVIHSEYGKQFKAEAAEETVPESLEGLLRYLSSGVIRGIGKATAQRIIDHFGEKVFEILSQAPHRIKEVPGIAEHHAELIAQAWREHTAERDVMIFLQGLGIGNRLAVKIHKEYGANTIATIRVNPYRLARDIEGIGFRKADQIARGLGIALDSSHRIEAGVLYALETLTNDGHVYAPRLLLRQKVRELLALPEAEEYDGSAGDPPDSLSAKIDEAIRALARESDIMLQHVPDEQGEQIEAVYLRPLFLSERGTAKRLLEMRDLPISRLRGAQRMAWTKFFDILQRDDQIVLTAQQRDAVQAALTHKISILTGGPGTGKTTTLRAVIRALEWNKARYELASPTGRAAKRLSEATSRPAQTIHRLLGYTPDEGFIRGEHEPLDIDMLIIDEASMLDQILIYNVLKALPPEAHLLLVGDVDQLLSVGAGDVLRDLIKGGVAHVTRLEAIFRQSSDSQIIPNAHRINQGEMPQLDNTSSDFFMFRVETPEAAADLVVDIVQNRIPRKFGFDPMTEIQVLAPMYRGAIGIQMLNERLQAALNPHGRNAEKKLGNTVYRVGDKVLQTRNNYEKEVFNGDIGIIQAIDFTAQKLHVVFDDREVVYDWEEAGDLLHAYAVSVHRSQGSEYPAVVLPIMPQHYMLLQRNLLYTAVTRARRLVVLVGTKRAVKMAVKNDQVARRYTALAWRLQTRNV
ncbi:MAG: ATP-dependent RecD-like DNA helicase [Candidatus Thermofonsia Clade 1 bacterium]|uniref:ATP-dependent RecD2 DNA helicase n=1 Tax=Candidatus Thermofonsia Clade 1 bacterium TaxID=2364210 RepID=A0A2M8P0I0_9CHLR|nr:MAG: ATP-dependent RecD-like DNA helicase [Candidatus Thermofonsia Clade 1 bacterium]